MLRCIFVLFIFLIKVTQAQTITDHIRTDGKSINVGRSTSRWQPLLDAADNRNAVDPVFDPIKIALIEALNKEDNIQLAGSRDSVVTI